MNKEDLRTGMKAITRNGSQYIVFTNYNPKQSIVLLSNRTNDWIDGTSLNGDLTCKTFSTFDVVEVYKPSHVYLVGSFFGANHSIDGDDWELVWQRESLKMEVQLKKLISDLSEQLKEAKDQLAIIQHMR